MRFSVKSITATIVDEVEGLFLKFAFDNHHVFFAFRPLIAPQQTRDLLFVSVLFELSVLGHSIELDEDTGSSLETIELILPDV